MIDQETVKRKLFLTPCKDKTSLKNWVKYFLGVDLFNTITSRHATSSPMDALWELYSFIMYPPSRKPEKFLFASARSTQKTLLASVVYTVVLIHDKRTSVHFAANNEQLKPAREYISVFFDRPYLRDILKSKPTAERFTVLIPEDANNEMWSNGKTSAEIQELDPLAVREAYLEMVTIAPSTTQGKHVPFLGYDEISTLKGHKVDCYKNTRKIPIAERTGKPYATFGISTRMGAYSVVEKEITDAAKTGLNVRRWTVFEGTEQCDDERSGTDFEHERYVSVIHNDIKTPEEFEKVEQKKKKDYDFVKLASGCLKCPLAKACGGDLKKPKPKSRHLTSIETAIVEYVNSDHEFYNSQCLSLMPSREGQVFPTFDKDTHSISADEMFEIFMGEKPQESQTISSLIKLFRVKGLKCSVGLDWGYEHPFALNVHFHDKERVFTLMSYAQVGLELHLHVIPLLKKLELQFGNFSIFPDNARPDNNKALITEGFSVIHVAKDTDYSIDIMRKMLKPNYGLPRWYLLKDHTESLTTSLTNYHYEKLPDGRTSDDVDKVDDDDTDACRYFFLGNFDNGREMMVVSEPNTISPEKYTPENIIQAKISEVTGNVGMGVTTKSSGTIGSFSWAAETDDDENY